MLFNDATALAAKAMESGDYSEVISCLERWCTVKDFHPHAALLSSRAYLKQGYYTKAAALLAAAVEMSPEKPLLRYHHARVLTLSGQFALAKERLRKAAEFGADRVQVSELMGRIALIEGDLAQARSMADLALADDPASIIAIRLSIESRLDQPDGEALETFLAHREALLDHPSVFNRLVRLVGTANPDRLDEVQAAVPISEPYLAGLVDLGKISLRAGNVERAVGLAKQLDDMGVGNLLASHLSLRTAEAMGDDQQVKQAQNSIGSLARGLLPSQHLEAAIGRAKPQFPTTLEKAASIYKAFDILRPSYSLDEFRQRALLGEVRAGIIAKWWRSGDERAVEIDALFESNDVHAMAEVFKASKGAIVVSNNAGPILASVRWLQTRAPRLLIVGKPLGSPYHHDNASIEVNVDVPRLAPVIRRLTKALKSGTVLAMAPQVSHGMGRLDSSTSTFFNRKFETSAFPARLAYMARCPVFWVQARWAGGSRVVVSTARMVGVRSGESRDEFIERWAKDYQQRNEAYFRSSPENVTPSAPFWSQFDAPDVYPTQS